MTGLVITLVKAYTSQRAPTVNILLRLNRTLTFPGPVPHS